MKLSKLLIALALVLTPAVAIAQPADEPAAADEAPAPVARHGRVQPVPAPSANENEKKEATESEHDEGPAPFKFWGDKIFNNPRPPFWAMLFNFGLLLLIYWRFGKKPVAEALVNRKQSIASAIENAQKILREAKQRSKRYRAKLEKVAVDAEQGKQTLVSTGQGESEMILRAADEKATRIARDADFLLDQEKKQTQIDLLRETVEKASKEAEDLLRKHVSAQDQERLAEEFIAKLSEDYAKGLPASGGA